MDALTDPREKRPRGRQPGSHVAPGLRRTKPRGRAPRDLVPIDKSSGAGRFFSRMVQDIENDLGSGSRRNLSRIELELINAFAGAATALQYLNHQILLGEGCELDLAGFSQLANVVLRIGGRLGTSRRLTKQTLDMNTFLELRRHERDEPLEGEIDGNGAQS
jgi:hypothetical protein